MAGLAMTWLLGAIEARQQPTLPFTELNSASPVSGGIAAVVALWPSFEVVPPVEPWLCVLTGLLLVILALQVAWLIHSRQARLYHQKEFQVEELQRLSGRLGSLVAVGLKAQESLSPHAVTSALGEELNRLGLRCILWDYQADGRRLVARATNLSPEAVASLEELLGVPFSEFQIRLARAPALDRLAQTGKAMFSERAAELIFSSFARPSVPVVERALEMAGVRSLIYVPLVTGKSIIGALTIWGPDLRRGDAPLVTLLGQQVANALYNAHQHEQESLRVGREVFTRRIAEFCSSTFDIDLIQETVVRELGRFLELACCHITEYSEDLLVARIRHAYVRPGASDPRGVCQPGQDWPDSLPLITKGELSFIHDVHQEDQSLPHIRLMRARGVRGWLRAPVVVGDRLVGLLGLGDDKPRRWTEAEQQVVRDVARLLAVATDRARLYRESQERAQHLETLHHLATQVTSSLEVAQTLEAIGLASMELLGADRCSIYQIDWNAGRVTALFSRGISQEYLAGLMVLSARPPMAATARGEALNLPDLLQDPRYADRRAIIEQEGVRGCINLPLVHRGQVLGSLNLYYDQPRVATTHEMSIGQSFAAQAAIAIANARLFEAAQRELAERRRVEEALRKSDEKFRLLGEHAPDVIIIRGPTDEADYLSPAAEGILGYSPREVYDGTSREAIVPADREKVAELRRTVREEGREATVEYRYQKKDGTQIWLWNKSVPLRDAAGHIVGRLSIVRDVTADKRAREEAAQTQARLLQATIEAQDSERQSLALGLHHQVVEPLVSALGHLPGPEGVVSEGAAGAPTGGALVRQRAQQALRGAQELMASLRLSAVPAQGLVEALRGDLEKMTEEGWQVDFAAQVGRLPHPIELALYRMATEALGNVRRHADTRRVAVHLKQQAEEVTLEVQDWGRGFDPQATLGQTARERPIGLLILRKRAELLGGTCVISSAPGRGTDIRIQVPVPAGAEAEDHSAPLLEDGSSVEPPSPASKVKG